MNHRHPFEWIDSGARTRVFAASFVVCIALLVSLNAFDRSLRTESAPQGIVSFELAGTFPASDKILQSWGPPERVLAGLSLGLDFLFMVSYAAAIGLGCVLLAQALGGGWARVGAALAWGQVAAAILDAIENVALIRLLLGAPSEIHPALAKWSAVPKFILVVVGLIYVALGAIILLIRRRTPSRTEPG